MSGEVSAAVAAPPQQTPGSHTGHVLVMDGLRGMAITLVVLFHYWQLSFYVIPWFDGKTLEWLQYGGFLGVELFFFISAFCLFLPYASGRVPTLRHFYYRRGIKILPSYLLAVFVGAFVFTNLYPSTWQHGKLADLGLHLLFLHNFSASTHGSFSGVLWSLAVEVQFYVIFPAVAWLFRRRPFITAALMIGISIAFRAWDRGRPGDDLGIYVDFLPAFLDLFAFGMLAAWVLVWVRERPHAAERVRVPLTAVAAVALVLIVLMFQWVTSNRGIVEAGIWQSENRSYIGALFMVLAVASAFSVRGWRAVLGNRVLVFLSTISYNLYLWHQFVGVFLRDRGWWPADTPVPTDDPTWRWSFFLLGVAVSIVIACLITYHFERPLLRNGVGGSIRKLEDIVNRRPGGPSAPDRESVDGTTDAAAGSPAVSP